MKPLVDRILENLDEGMTPEEKSKTLVNTGNSKWISGISNSRQGLELIVKNGEAEDAKLAKSALADLDKAWKKMKPFHDYVKGRVNNYR